MLLASRHSSLLLALLVAGAPVLSAQSITTGSITGTLRDTSGKPVPGAQVRVRSSQIVRTVTSDGVGAFRFSLMNPGEWELIATKDGMQSLSMKVLVQTNSTQALSLTLQVIASATVQVTEEAPSVDVTTVQSGALLTQETMAALPSTRSIQDVFALTPGVFKTAGNEIAVSGATGNDNQFVTDGLVTNDWKTGTSGKVTLPQEWFEQIEVLTGGFKPEFSALGGVVNAVTRSGSNTFTADGQVFMNFPNSQARDYHWDPTNPVPQVRPNLNREYGFSAAGPIVKDKLFYFIGLNRVESTGTTESFAPNYDGLRSSAPEVKSWTGLMKVNYFPHRDHQLTLSASYTNNNAGQEHIYSQYGTGDSGVITKTKNTNLNLTWDWNLASNVILSTRMGQAKININTMGTGVVDAPGSYYFGDFMYWELGPGVTRPKPGNYSTNAGYIAYTTIHGGGVYYPKDDYTNTQFRVDLSWFFRNHALKFGYSQQQPDYDNIGKTTGMGSLLYGLGLNRTQMMQFTGDFSGRGQNAIRSYYAQDVWEVSPGVRVIYGARYETQEARNGKGVQFWNFKGLGDLIQPRLGVSWDVNRDGRTKLFASWGKYFETVPLLPVQNSGSDAFKRTNIYITKVLGNPYPTDAIATATYDPATGTPAITGAPIASMNQTLASEVPTIEKDIKLTNKVEWTLGWEQQLDKGLSLSTTFTYRELKDVIETSYLTDAAGNSLLNIGDGSPAQVLWNPRPGVVSFNIGKAVPKLGGTVQQYDMGLYHEPVNRYYSLGAVLTKKAEKWFANLSYVFSRAYGNYDGTGTVGSDSYFVPNKTQAMQYYYGGDGSGPLSFDRTHVVKLQGNYVLPLFGHTLNLGASGKFETGVPRTATVPAITVYPAITDQWVGTWGVPVNRTLGNLGRTDNVMNLDLNLSYQMKLGKVLVTPTLNVFNVFNNRARTGFVDVKQTHNQYSGVISDYPYYGELTDKQSGRWTNFGVKFKF